MNFHKKNPLSTISQLLKKQTDIQVLKYKFEPMPDGNSIKTMPASIPASSQIEKVNIGSLN